VGPRNAPGEIVLLDVATGAEIRRSGAMPAPIFLRFSPDRRWLAARYWASEDFNSGAVTVFDASNWNPVSTAADHGFLGYFCAFSPDSGRLAVSRENHVAVLEVPSGRELRRIAAPEGTTGAVAWSPDGRWIAAAPEPTDQVSWPVGRAIRLFDAETGSEAHALPMTAGESIRALAFSPDGRRLASAGVGQRIRIWDTESGLELLVLSAHAHVVWGLSFSPDGHRLASTSGDKTVRIWDASPVLSEGVRTSEN
jgi:WD40 repeat protein